MAKCSKCYDCDTFQYQVVKGDDWGGGKCCECDSKKLLAVEDVKDIFMLKGMVNELKNALLGITTIATELTLIRVQVECKNKSLPKKTRKPKK